MRKPSRRALLCVFGIFTIFILICFFLLAHGLTDRRSQDEKIFGEKELKKKQEALNEKYYEMGRALGHSRTQVISALQIFENDISIIYSELGAAMNAMESREALSSWNRMELQYAISSSNSSLVAAEKKFLRSVGMQQELIETEFRQLYTHSSEKLAVALPAEFREFIAGISDPFGYHITSYPGEKKIRKGPVVIFPDICFSNSVREEGAAQAEEVYDFINSGIFKENLLRDLYRFENEEIVKVTLGASRGYSLQGVVKTCGMLGEVSKRGKNKKIFIYEKDINEEAQVKKRPYLKDSILKEVEIHETFHYLSRNDCEEIGKNEVVLGNAVFSRRRMREALASIGTISALAYSNDESLSLVLVNNFVQSEQQSYGLLADLFFSRLFTDVSKRQIPALQKHALSRYELLLDASPEEVLAAGESALRRLLAAQNTLCVAAAPQEYNMVRPAPLPPAPPRATPSPPPIPAPA